MITLVTKLAAAILTALQEQSWTVSIGALWVEAISPTSPQGFVFPADLLEQDALEGELRLVLLSIVVFGGLEWPWPPDIDDDVLADWLS